MAVAEVTGAATGDAIGVERTKATWYSMRSRCADTDGARRTYPRYAGRGIRVCGSWRARDGFARFLADMGSRPEKHEIDRIDNDGNYSCGHCDECRANGWPANCRWVTRSVNVRNRSNTIRVNDGGQVVPLISAIEARGITRADYIYQRIYGDGWTAEEALTRPRGPTVKQRQMEKLWRDAHTLYDGAYDGRLRNELLTVLVEHFGPWLERAEPGCAAWEEAEDEPVQHPGTQRNAYIWGLAPPAANHAYECGDCHKLFSIGFGCTLCMGAMCAACFDAERHTCQSVHGSHTDGVERYGLTLEDVGAIFGFTRERARQIERRGLDKLRPALLGAVPIEARVDGDTSNAWGAYE